MISFTIFVFVWIFAMSHKTARESETISQRIDQLICDLFVGFLQAAADEFHQYFVEGRNPLVKDVLLDVSGVCTGIVLVVFFALLLNIVRRYRMDRCRPDVKPGRGCIC